MAIFFIDFHNKSLQSIGRDRADRPTSGPKRGWYLKICPWPSLARDVEWSAESSGEKGGESWGLGHDFELGMDLVWFLVSVLGFWFWVFWIWGSTWRTNCARHLACKMRSRLSKSSNYMLAESCWGKPQRFSFTLSSGRFLSLSMAVQLNEIERRWSPTAWLRPFLGRIWPAISG